MSKLNWESAKRKELKSSNSRAKFTLQQKLDKALEQGAKRERERIIKLFESKSECKPESGHDWNGDCYCEVIALIKGENK
jgi:hypothetical protein